MPEETQPPLPPVAAEAETSPAVPDLNQRFSEAWINRDDHIVCGVRLRPYCMEHAMNLQILASPFISSDPAAVMGWADLFRAVAICSAGFEQMPKFPSNPRIVNWTSGERLLHWLTRGRLGTTLALEAAKFRAYQNDYQSEPDLFFTDNGRELTAPVFLARAVFLQRTCFIPEERAWTMPIGKALWTYATALEQLSENVSLLEDEEAALMAKIMKIQSGEIPPPPIEGAEGQPAAPGKSRIDESIFGPAAP